MENELLHKEVDRLQSLLCSKGTHLTQPIIKRHLSLEEKWMCSAISSKDVRMYSRGDGTAGQAENPATSLYVGTNGIGNCVTRKDINVRNAPTGLSSPWSMRISIDILKGRVRTGRM